MIELLSVIKKIKKQNKNRLDLNFKLAQNSTTRSNQAYKAQIVGKTN